MELKLGKEIRITDPCYDDGIWCGETLEIVEGLYLCHTTTDGKSKRPKSMSIIHTDYAGKDFVREYEGCVCVDSGQMGIFNYDYFAKIKADDKVEESWYKRVCEITLSDDTPYGIIDGNGFVCESGHGDGEYEIYSMMNGNDEIVGIEIVFIEEDELED